MADSDSPGQQSGNAASASGSGLFRPVSVVLLVVAVVAVGVAAVMLARTFALAQSVSGKAETIAKSGRGINASTDSIIQLRRTNEAAESILGSVTPLPGALSKIAGSATDINRVAGTINSAAGSINTVARSINTVAGSINSSAGKIETNAKNINSTAGRINSTAKDINSVAAEILDVAQLVDRDALNINLTLQPTIDLAGHIGDNTSDIVHQAVQARQTSSCIAEKLLAGPPQSTDDCFKSRG